MSRGGPSEEEKEAVKKRFADLKAQKGKPKRERVTPKLRALKAAEEKYEEFLERDALIQREKDIHPKRYAAWLKAREEREKDIKSIIEDEKTLLKEPTTWEDHAIRGIIFHKQERKKKAIESIQQALQLNHTDLVLLSLGFYTANLNLWIAKRILQGDEFEMSYEEVIYHRKNALMFLLRSPLDDDWYKDRINWIPEYLQTIVVPGLVLIDLLEPNNLLLEIADRIRKKDKRNNDWIYRAMRYLTLALVEVGYVENEEAAEEFIVNAVANYKS